MANSWHAGATAFEPPGAANTPLQQSPVLQTSPNPAQPLGEDVSGRKRKRSSVASEHGGHASVDSSIVGSPLTGRQRHQPGVKRACNECRQQKLRCNVFAGPGDHYKPCDRCEKHKLECSIDNDFKRQGKRAANVEMAKELELSKARVAELEALLGPEHSGLYSTLSEGPAPIAQMANQPFLGPSEAAASRSLLDLSQGYRELPPTSFPSITPGATPRTLRQVTLSDNELTDLYAIYFASYHPFLPVLNPEWNFNQYYSLHPLLHWTIVATAARRYDAMPSLLVEVQQPLEEMLWKTLSQVPQIYHVCKALALLCCWPLPTSSTSTEPTMMLSGVMFQLAMQYGLHRPSHAQDFSRFHMDLREEDIADRLNTWAAVNIVAQMVSTGQGQPPLSRWAWYTYGLHLNVMKPGLHTRCQVEKFCDTVTRTLFTMQRDHVVEVDQVQSALQIDMYARELNEMELTIMSTSSSPIEILFLKAAALHLRLTAFFHKETHPNYMTDLRNVYIAASSLLTHLIELPVELFHYVPRYIEQMMLAGACALMKLLNSFYAAQVDLPASRTVFGNTVNALRRLSVRSNDLPQRLAEVMAQLWQSSGASEQRLFQDGNPLVKREPDESLQLRVRCRSSLSVLYDAIWRWRQQVGQDGPIDLEKAVEHPTAIATLADTARNTPPLGAIGGSTLGQGSGLGGVEGDGLDMQWDNFGGNAVFDPLSWALDGNLHFGGGFGLGGSDGLGGFQA
ncbi:hypothetical protein LTR08_007027 [Meristemomyces frigidus]|nr:hypothetical protein LTR08_007027 [Meristemomyces frigidus]